MCPAGVRYGEMFEHARADIEQAGVMRNPQRDLVRALTLRWLFKRPQALRAAGRLVWFYQASGLESLVQRLKLTALLPSRLRALEPLTPRVQRKFSDAPGEQGLENSSPHFAVGGGLSGRSKVLFMM